jgi:acetyltransferase-like isoleucine patch superfamily enzyme
MYTSLTQDVPPYVLVSGNPASAVFASSSVSPERYTVL